MSMTQHWTGDIPTQPMVFTVRDARGAVKDCSGYSDVRMIMLDSNNREVDLSGGTLVKGAAQFGRFTYVWPADKSLFTEAGDYVVQLVLTSNTNVDKTSAHTIRVRELGKVVR